MTSRTVLITGTSSGIGLYSAVAAASAGWTVIATMRDTARDGRLRDAASAAGVELDIRTLDVTDRPQIDAVVAGVVADHGGLDAVINNAGAAGLGTIEWSSMQEVRDIMEVDFFSVAAVSQAAMPHLRARRGRLLTISSVGGAVGQPFNEAYCAAKFAVEGFMQALHPVAATVGVAVAVIEPAAVASDFVANAAIDRDALLARAGHYGPALSAYLERTAGAFANAQPADEVGAFVAAALDRDPLPFRLQTSDAARAFAGRSLADLDGSAITGFTASWVA